MGSEAATATRVLTFDVGGRAFAIDAAAVAEVVSTPPVTRVPQAPAALKGLANVRGRVAPIVALDRVLDDVGPSTGACVIVLSGESPIGLAVDSVIAMRDVAAHGRTHGATGELIETAEGPLRLLRLDALLSSTFGAGAGPASARRAAARVESPPAPVRSAELAFLEFRVSGQAYATPLDDVRDVSVAPAQMQALPGADAAMRGLVARRDRLLPVISAATVLGLPEQPRGPRARILAVAIGEAEAGLLVDEVRGVLRTTAARVDAVPSLLNRAAGEARIESIVRTDAGLVSILPAARVLDEPTIAALLAEGAGRGREAATEEGSGAVQRVLVFRLGDETYGLPIEDVEAVVRLPDAITRVPGAPPFVSGVINHRGRVTPLVDQAQRFAAPGVGGGRRRVIITSLGDLTAGFIVDAVEQVVAVADEALQPTPDLAAGEGGVFDRVASIEHEGRLLLLVDPQQLLNQAERDVIQALLETSPTP